MKFSATFLALCLASANAFTTPAAFGVRNTQLMMSDAVAEPETVEEEAAVGEAPVAPPAALSGLRIQDVRKAVANVNKDNFSKTLEELESFLTNEAGATVYSKSIRRLNVQAQALGLEMPEGYAKEAKATQKKREKQNAFIQTKEEERLAAEAEAAEASAEEETEEAAPAEEEAAPVEA